MVRGRRSSAGWHRGRVVEGRRRHPKSGVCPDERAVRRSHETTGASPGQMFSASRKAPAATRRAGLRGTRRRRVRRIPTGGSASCRVVRRAPAIVGISSTSPEARLRGAAGCPERCQRGSPRYERRFSQPGPGGEPRSERSFAIPEVAVAWDRSRNQRREGSSRLFESRICPSIRVRSRGPAGELGRLLS